MSDYRDLSGVPCHECILCGCAVPVEDAYEVYPDTYMCPDCYLAMEDDIIEEDNTDE